MIFQRHSIQRIFRVRTAALLLAVLLAVGLSATTGCFSGKFFTPPCQDTNSCGGGGGGTNSSYAFVANSTTQTLATFPLPTATFTSITGTSTTLGVTPSALAATPSGTLLYVATLNGTVVVYTIGTNGALTQGNGGQAVAQTLNPTWITIDPSGSWLFLISSSINALFEYQINTTSGVLTQQGSTSGIALDAGGPTQIYITPNNQNLYVGVGGGGFDSFSFNSSTGALSNQQHINSRNGGGDNAFASDTNSKFLFVGEAGQGIRVFTIASGNALTEISGSPFTTPLGPSSMVVDPSNTYLYVANKTAGVISGYTIASGGALTPLASSPFQAGTGPSALSLDSTGKYLLATSTGGGPDLQVFSFDATTAGKLDPVASASTGTDPTGAIALSVVR